MAIILRYFAEFGSFVANYIQVAQPLAETALKNGLVSRPSGCRDCKVGSGWLLCTV